MDKVNFWQMILKPRTNTKAWCAQMTKGKIIWMVVIAFVLLTITGQLSLYTNHLLSGKMDHQAALAYHISKEIAAWTPLIYIASTFCMVGFFRMIHSWFNGQGNYKNYLIVFLSIGIFSMCISIPVAAIILALVKYAGLNSPQAILMIKVIVSIPLLVWQTMILCKAIAEVCYYQSAWKAFAHSLVASVLAGLVFLFILFVIFMIIFSGAHTAAYVH